MKEAEIVFTHILNCNRASLYMDKELTLNLGQALAASEVFKRRIIGEPLQYILGSSEFMGLDFKVNKNVLIPRPETEIVVETVINIVRKFESSIVRKLRILDLGTGSGCIAVSLAKNLTSIEITATDISKEALEVAKDNALLHGVADKINFIQSDLFANSQLRASSCELIISNPPYVCSGDIETLAAEISHEPEIALDGGADGLNFYRKILSGGADYLAEDGLIILELGFNQRKAFERILEESGKFKLIEIIKDYNNIERVVTVKKEAFPNL